MSARRAVPSWPRTTPCRTTSPARSTGSRSTWTTPPSTTTTSSRRTSCSGSRWRVSSDVPQPWTDPHEGAGAMTWALATIAALVIGYATVSRRLEAMDVSGAMAFTTAGLLVGAVGLLDLKVHGEQVKLLAESTLTLVLFADASRISLRALRHEFAVPLRLLGIGLPLTIVAGALVGAVVVPGVSFAEALVLAIVLACTDAALGQAVVSDERVPSRIRQGLNVESGL